MHSVSFSCERLSVMHNQTLVRFTEVTYLITTYLVVQLKSANL